jgi:hypothetical protein
MQIGSVFNILAWNILFKYTCKADAAAWEDIIVAKKEAVGLQMEAVYRARLQEAYTQARLFICSYLFLKLDEIYIVQKLLLSKMK